MKNTYGHAQPFSAENCTGYTQEEMDALNTEFESRWNGWSVDETSMFLGLDEAEAEKHFQDEVARR